MEGYSKYFENDDRILNVVYTKFIENYCCISSYQYVNCDFRAPTEAASIKEVKQRSNQCIDRLIANFISHFEPLDDFKIRVSEFLPVSVIFDVKMCQLDQKRAKTAVKWTFTDYSRQMHEKGFIFTVINLNH